MNGNYISRFIEDYQSDSRLYHYTSKEGVLGMLSDLKIRLSHILFLNDSEEFFNCWKIFFDVFTEWNMEESEVVNDKGIALVSFKTRIKELFKTYNIDFNPMALHSMFGKLDMTTYEYFVFSLSKEIDDLSQWRAYSPSQSGINLGFKFPPNFRETFTRFVDKGSNPTNLNNCKIYLCECIYDDTLKKKILQGLLDHYFNRFLHEENGHLVPSFLFYDILTLNLFFKTQVIQVKKNADC